MRIDPTQIITSAKTLIKKGIKNTTEIGSHAKEGAVSFARSTDKFIKDKTNKSILEAIKKASITKDTVLGAFISLSVLVLAFQALKGIKNKISELIKK